MYRMVRLVLALSLFLQASPLFAQRTPRLPPDA
jgi:hypothetical protein